jgi:hypothetical protein
MLDEWMIGNEYGHKRPPLLTVAGDAGRAQSFREKMPFPRRNSPLP